MNKSSWNTPVRPLAAGIGQAVAERTILRTKSNGTLEDWGDVARRVSTGNAMLRQEDSAWEFDSLHRHMRQASVLMSGRHLQHGDSTQSTRPIEVFSNCLEGSTRILTMEHGPIEIEKIAGQKVSVLAGDGKPREAVIYSHGKQAINEITFRGVHGVGKIRKTVKATSNHRWKLRDGSISDNLQVGDVLAPVHGDVGFDPVGVVHGLIYGDGTANANGGKRRHDGARHFSQGRTYAGIRVCKQDAAQDEIHQWLDSAGYSFTTPASASGDRVYYIGKFEGAKGVPFTRDLEYIAGFIYGWWLADGSKNVYGALEISCSNAEAMNWLEEHVAYAGFNITSHRIMERKEGDGSFANGKPLHVVRLRKGAEWKVDSIESCGVADVYCPEEPVTGTFVLANGMLTGNCSTAASTFIMFYLLLNGSGVGRSYDDDMMVVDWSKNMPHVIPVIRANHPDVLSGEISEKFVSPDFPKESSDAAKMAAVVYEVLDSREGWAKAFEKIEYMTWTGEYANTILLLDFSHVRARGEPIGGMQNRPASGPGPIMGAIKSMAALKDSGMAPWHATMYADHYSAECVLVGGARRSARMATKSWRDDSVFEFISVKKGGVLWSSNNSVTVDEEFWTLVKGNVGDGADWTTKHLETHAKKVFEAICRSSYMDGTGEPGLINVERLVQNDEGIEALLDGNYAESSRFFLDDETKGMTAQIAKRFAAKRFKQICNPCSEISLSMIGGYCLIADVVPYHAGKLDQSSFKALKESAKAWDDEAEDAFRVTTRALLRTNTMNALYQKEVHRTNRIGVGITGLHEYAWTRFGLSWRELIDEEKSIQFWRMLSRFSNACVDEAYDYCEEMGVSMPHSVTTMKPSGCTTLDTTVKTTNGVMSMSSIFAANGCLNGIQYTVDGTWIEPTVKIHVLDENNEPKQVTKLYVNGVRPVFEIEFEDGHTVKLTGNHKLKTVGGWKRADELTEADEIISY